jgi:hypothetical protein
VWGFLFSLEAIIEPATEPQQDVYEKGIQRVFDDTGACPAILYSQCAKRFAGAGQWRHYGWRNKVIG